MRDVRALILLGEAGSGEPFGAGTDSGRRLRALLGGDPPPQLVLTNLVQEWSSFWAPTARMLRDAAASARLAGFSAALLAGQRVAAAFGQRGRQYFEWFDLRGLPAAVLPHLSWNRWWNDEGRRDVAARFLRDVVEAVSTGESVLGIKAAGLEKIEEAAAEKIEVADAEKIEAADAERIPTVEALPVGTPNGLRAWCPYCASWHFHGSGEVPVAMLVEGQSLGHRVADCGRGGYYLRFGASGASFVVPGRVR